MGAGLEIYSPAGDLLMDGTGRYGRIIDIFQPNLGSGSRTYSDIDPRSLDFVYYQGDRRVLTVWKDGNTVYWRLDDAYYAQGFSGPRQLIVLAF